MSGHIAQQNNRTHRTSFENRLMKMISVDILMYECALGGMPVFSTDVLIILFRTHSLLTSIHVMYEVANAFWVCY